MLCLAGFGNLSGGVEVWAVHQRKRLVNWSAADSTIFLWASDGIHLLTATTAPRLRVNNGIRIYKYNGELVCRREMPRDGSSFIYDATWRPVPEGVFKAQPLLAQSNAQSNGQEAPKAYIPPHLRGMNVQPASMKLRYVFFC